MLLNPHHIQLASGRDVNRYLDDWAEGHLISAERWQGLLDLTRDWVDYSARNQILLAAHGAVGPVAGIETWRLVPSADRTSPCAIRSGEHGLPVRVPVTTGALEPDPHVGRARPTQSAVAGWEWRSVFCLEQLVRRPAIDRLERPSLPEHVLGSDPKAKLLATIEAVAKPMVRGRLPQVDDPAAALAQAASRLPRNAQRPALDETLSSHAASLVLQRIQPAANPLPQFDPSLYPPRERWELALDVLDPARRLTAGLGKRFGVDLLESPLPRMVIDDDRVVPAERKNRLPRASLAQLPVGEWVEVGPYTATEWAARGEDASGRGAYLRLNTTAYLVVAERGDEAIWRLEDTRARLGAGVLAGGDATSIEDAQQAAVGAMRSRYPQLETARPAATQTPEPDADSADGQRGWESVPGGASDLTRRRPLGREVTAYVMPLGDSWMPCVQAGRAAMIEPVADPVATREEAMSVAVLAGRRAARELHTDSRVDFDASVARLADSPDYTRDALVTIVSTRLDSPERAALVSDPSTTELVGLLGDAGVASATTVAVLRAEGIEPTEVAPVLPLLGLSPATGIEVLRERWGTDNVTAAELVGASAIDMRTAGCEPTEIVRARPTQIIEHLPADPHLWDLAGGTLGVTGHHPNDIAGFLATYAPNPECFAAAISAGIDDPTLGVCVAVRRGMPPDAVALTTEAYGLSPHETAVALGDAGAPPSISVPVLLHRCDGDTSLTTQIARSALGLNNEAVIEALQATDPLDAAEISELRAARPLSRDPGALIASHTPPRPAPAVRDSNAAMLLDCLPDPISTPGVEPDSLLDNLPAADDSLAVGTDLLASIPDPELPDHAPNLEITP